MIKPTFTFADEYLPYHPERKCFIDLIPGAIAIYEEWPEENIICSVTEIPIFQLPLRKPGDTIIVATRC